MATNRKPKPVRKLAPAKRVQMVESSAASVFGPAAAGVQRALAWFGTWRGVRAPRDEIAGVLLLVLGEHIVKGERGGRTGGETAAAAAHCRP